jgi:hypothetical protein
MLGYEKGFVVKTKNGLVKLTADNIKATTAYGNACALQEKIQTTLYPDKYDDETALELAEAAISIADNAEDFIKPHIDTAIENGFYPTKKQE